MKAQSRPVERGRASEVSVSLRLHNNDNDDKRIYKENYKFNVVALNGDTIFNNMNTIVPFSKPITKITIKYNNETEMLVTPEQTKEIFIKKSKGVISGIPHDGSWIFNMHSTDNLKIYARFPDKDFNYAAYYQINGNPIESITSDAVKEIIQGNAKAEKEWEKANIRKALEIYVKDVNKNR